MRSLISHTQLFIQLVIVKFAKKFHKNIIYFTNFFAKQNKSLFQYTSFAIIFAIKLQQKMKICVHLFLLQNT